MLSLADPVEDGSMVFFALLALPLLVAVAGFALSRHIVWQEFLLQVGAQVLVAGASFMLLTCSSMADTQVINGRIREKHAQRESCEHSYECFCVDVPSCTSNGKTTRCTSTRVCQTCYEHSYDMSWLASDTTDETYRIDRVDRQGLTTPSRWASIQVGDPTSHTETYSNYVRASKGSLFRREHKVSDAPEYPLDVRDYYKLDRFVPYGVQVPNASEWNQMLANVSGETGPAFQVNVVVVLTTKPPEWFADLEAAWVGGKKNDVVLVVGTTPDLRPQWANVMAWSTNKEVEVYLRNEVMAMPQLTPSNVGEALLRNVRLHYRRKPMSDFEYLKYSVKPTVLEFTLALVVGLLVASLLTYLMIREDLFGSQNKKGSYRVNHY